MKKKMYKERFCHTVETRQIMRKILSFKISQKRLRQKYLDYDVKILNLLYIVRKKLEMRQ